MRYSKSQIHSRVYKIPDIKYEDQRLSSYSGLIILQILFSKIDLKNKLKKCFRHIKENTLYGFHVITLALILHLILGFRFLRESKSYKEDPIVLRVLGLRNYPDVSTITRNISIVDDTSIIKIKKENMTLILDVLKKLNLSRITLDFDGSVLSTGRYAEGTAVGFNKKKKGGRSYYPLFCMIAQTGQVFDVHHRPGNVHDSNGAKEFILDCISHIREVLPDIKIEIRMDSAFFSDKILKILTKLKVEFTISVPFERFPELKNMIELRKRWFRIDKNHSYFEIMWSPKSWDRDYRFFCIRQKVKKQNKEPIQLDLFVPHVYGYDFKVIVTNKKNKAKKILKFHNGRGYQEKIFGELKTQINMDYVPVRTLNGNKIYLMSCILSHNLIHALQMEVNKPKRKITEKQTPLWDFKQIQTLRNILINKAGRLTKPNGKLTLTMSTNKLTKDIFSHFHDYLAEKEVA